MNTNVNTDDKRLKDILTPIQNHNPMSVPQGYFDTLPKRIMINVRESQFHPKRRRKSRFLIRLTAAAVLTGFFSLAGLMTYEQNHTITPMTASSDSNYADMDFNDEMLEYAMLDNNDIEYYLTIAE